MARTTATYTRRGALALGGAVAISGVLRWLFPHPLRDDSNDFPVSSYRPPGESVDLSLWRLRVVGAVANPVALSYHDLVSLPRQRDRYALTCVTGWSSVRDWEGIPISTLLAMARPLSPEAGLCLASADGLSLALPPSRYQSPGAMVVTHVAGSPLSHDHGFPARLMLPAADGVDNIKWLAEIQVLDALPATAGDGAGGPG